MRSKVLRTIMVDVFVIAVVSAELIAAKPNEPGGGQKPDKQKPVPATNVEVVKKISLRGRPPWAGGDGGGKGKKEQAATGVLGESTGGSKYAVIIGISDYPGTENDLDCCHLDAIDMENALATLYGFTTNVTTLIDSAATRDAILTAIEDVGESAASGDEVVFFFSGHGVKGLAQDWDKEKVDEGICVWGKDELDNDIMTYIWDGELESAFREFLTSRIIFVFDTCLAGGMKSDLEQTGRIIAMASTENGYSYESEDLQNGEFTYYFVDDGMLGGMANVHDYDGNGNIEEAVQVTVEEAYDYAKTNCSLDKPTISDEFENDFLP
jgi:hypothetical protein